MKRGEIYFANLDPTVGAEIKKIRPVLIASNNANNKVSDLITVIPVTSNIKKIYPFDVFLDKKNAGLAQPSKAQCNQIRTISKMRIRGKKLGCLNTDGMLKIRQAVQLHLDF